MSVAAEFTFFEESRPAVIVASHERSGTHFLMNSIASCYGYVSLPWINFDMPDQNVLEHYSREQIADILLAMTVKPMANIVKLHHCVDFFTGQLERLLERYVILVVYRDPVAVMTSFWRYLHHFPAANQAGPQVADPITFACAKPFGRLLRYQTTPSDTVLERWASHVKGWYGAAQKYSRIALIRYEDLDVDYVPTMQSLAPWLGRSPRCLERPARDYNVIPPGPTDPMRTGITPALETLRKLCRDKVGATMQRLGY
jgi:hypothetical protein